MKERHAENLSEDLCHVLKLTVNIDLAPAGILAIHRGPGGFRDGPWPVIANFCDTKTWLLMITAKDINTTFRILSAKNKSTGANYFNLM